MRNLKIDLKYSKSNDLRIPMLNMNETYKIFIKKNFRSIRNSKNKMLLIHNAIVLNPSCNIFNMQYIIYMYKKSFNSLREKPKK